MKKISQKIDRATLLKSGGITALVAAMAGANANADVVYCCDPGDFGYQTPGFGLKRARKRPKHRFATIIGLHYVKIKTAVHGAPKPSATPPPGYQWDYEFMISGANGFGTVGHDQYGRAQPDNTKNTDVYIYVITA